MNFNPKDMLFEPNRPQSEYDVRQNYIERIHEENSLLRSDRRSLIAALIIVLLFMTYVTVTQEIDMEAIQLENQQLKLKNGSYELSNNL